VKCPINIRAYTEWSDNSHGHSNISDHIEK